MSDKLKTCLGIVKCRSYRYLSASHPGTCTVLPCTQLYIKRPLVNGYALDNTTTDLSSHVPCVYWETPLGYLIHLRKSLCPSCLEPYTENNIQRDYYARTLEVYHEWHLLDNPGERLDYLNSSCHLSVLV